MRNNKLYHKTFLTKEEAEAFVHDLHQRFEKKQVSNIKGVHFSGKHNTHPWYVKISNEGAPKVLERFAQREDAENAAKLWWKKLAKESRKEDKLYKTQTSQEKEMDDGMGDEVQGVFKESEASTGFLVLFEKKPRSKPRNLFFTKFKSSDS